MTRVIAFTSKHCGPCKLFSPRFALWAEKYARDGLEFVSVDSDAETAEVVKYGVSAVPSVVVETDGVAVAGHRGAPSESWLESHLPNPLARCGPGNC